MSVAMQTAMAAVSSTADSAALQKSKEQVESTLDKLLTGFKETACMKLTLCERRLAQKVQLEGVLAVTSDLPAPAAPASGLASVPQSAAELASFVADNGSKLTSCQRLVTAFEKTKKARDALQACLEEEHQLLNELDKPVQHSLQLSRQAVNLAATKLRLDDPQREQWHTEMLLRCTTSEASV